MTSQLGRILQDTYANQSGGALALGSVCVLDITNTRAVTTTSTPAYTDSPILVSLGVVADTVTGLFQSGGLVARVNLDGSANLGDFIATGTTPGQGTPHAAPQVSGDFAIALDTGTNPPCLMLSGGGSGGGAPSGPAAGDLDGTYPDPLVVFASGQFEMAGQVRQSAFIEPTTISAQQNNYNPSGLSGAMYLLLTGDGTTRHITGLQGGGLGRLITIINAGASDLVLDNASGSSSGANQFNLPNGADVTIPFGGAATLWYKSTLNNWFMVGKSF